MPNWTPLEVELLRFFGQTLVVVLGWWAVHSLSGRRAKTEAQRRLLIEECSDLIGLADEIFASALAYHTNQRIAADEQKLTMALQDLTSRVSLILRVASGCDLTKLTGAAIAFNQACTLQHFGEEHLHALVPTDEIVRALEAAQLRVRLELSELRFSLLATTKLSH